MTTLVRFTLGPYACGIEAGEVREVLRIVEITPIPRAPEFVEGVVNLRGAIIPIIDLRKRCGVVAGVFDSATRILVLKLRGSPAGLIVDDVTDVADVDGAGAGIDPSEALGIDLRQYAARVITIGDQLTVVIEPARILTEAEATALEATPLPTPADGDQA